MINSGVLFKRVLQDLPFIKKDQESVNHWVAKRLKGMDADSLVEGHNLAIKVQRAFENFIFKNALEDQETK